MSGTAGPANWDASASMDDRRDEIMRSLSRLIRDRRISTLSMQDVADHLGMTKGNLYYYFGSKQDLLVQCHFRGMEVSMRLLEAAQRSQAAPTDRLRDFLCGLVASVIADPYGAVLTLKLDTLSPPNRARYVALRDCFEQGLRDLIAEGCAAKELAVTDVKMAGFAILGAINAISAWYTPDGQRSPEYIADAYADLLLCGLRART